MRGLHHLLQVLTWALGDMNQQTDMFSQPRCLKHKSLSENYYNNSKNIEQFLLLKPKKKLQNMPTFEYPAAFHVHLEEANIHV